MATPLETCPRCGGPLTPQQDFCLECGARIPRPHGVTHELGVAWRRRLRWYPGDWIWPSLAALLLAAGGAAAAVAANHSGKSAAPQTVVATSKLIPAPAETAPPPAPTTTAPAKPGKPKPKPKPKPQGPISWPGQNGWTIVLSSIPVNGGAAEARQTAKDAMSKGLKEVGILVSSRYSSLHPGYYVVFTGVYSAQADAQAALSGVTPSYSAAYVRQIAR